MAYINHASITEDIPKTQQALVKVIRQGYALIMDPLLTFFVPNLHCTPLGMVDLNKLHKNPRPIFDSSFRSAPWAMAINDFTSKHSEREIVFPLAWVRYLTWLWNLRITYPWLELYPSQVQPKPRCDARFPSVWCPFHVHRANIRRLY
jgi:hypothetical protein